MKVKEEMEADTLGLIWRFVPQVVEKQGMREY